MNSSFATEILEKVKNSEISNAAIIEVNEAIKIRDFLMTYIILTNLRRSKEMVAFTFEN